MSSSLRLYAHKYDIRGPVSNKFGPKQAYLIGRGFAEFIKKTKHDDSVMVGCDTRPSGPQMLNSLISGLMDSGIRVINIGVATTPMVRFSSMLYNVAGSVMVTASHNSLDENGFKFTLDGHPFYDHCLQELCQKVENESFTCGAGTCIEQSVEDSYLENLCKSLRLGGQMKVTWIARNQHIRSILEKLIARIPGHHKIESTLVYNGADLTFDFDTDADRMSLYDSNFRQWHGDEILAFYALNMKQKYPNLKTVFDLKSSRVLMEWLRMQGISCDISRVGSCFIDNKLKKNKAHLGGETSGHFMFVDYNNFCDDGIYSALRVLDYVSQTSGKIEPFLEILPQIHITKTIKVSCMTNNKFEVIEQLKSRLINDDVCIHSNEEDAILVQQMEGWYVIRTSQTENIISVRCEGFQKDLLDSLLLKVENLFAEVGLSLW